jgi:hypothetical protein
MKRIFQYVFTLLCTVSSLGGCNAMESLVIPDENREIGIVVMDQLGPYATIKDGIRAVSDTGRRVFTHAELNATNGAVSSYSDTTIPHWVRVTWRTDITNNNYWTSGRVIGDYTVQVRDRIPDEVIKYVVAARDRALVLHFRVKNDAVLLAWDVQQRIPKGYGRWGWDYVMHGGDFKDPKLFNGKVVEAGWEKPQKYSSHGASGGGDSTHSDHDAKLK